DHGITLVTMDYLLWLAAPLVLGFVRGDHKVDTRNDQKDFSRIRCPVCRWQPEKHSRWSCNPDGCGHTWNTFETHVLCPHSGKQRFHPSCLRCEAWSPHVDWYEREERPHNT